MTLPALDLIRDDELKRVPDNFQRVREWAKKAKAELDALIASGGAAPHAASHENGGGDELNVNGLSGVLADPQTPAAHFHDGGDITTGTVAPARLGSGSGGAVKFLREDSSWQLVGGGSTPSGSGFRHVTAGVEDAASKLVDTADINNDQVTYAKMQNFADASRLLGRGDSGAGDPEVITVGSGLEISGTQLGVNLSGVATEYLDGTGNFTVPEQPAPQMAESNRTPASDVTITGGYGVVIPRKLTISSGRKIILSSGAILRIL